MDNPKVREDVGNKIKTVRLKSKMTQAQAAKKTGINTNYFARIERGEVNTSLDKLQRIAEVLGIRGLI